MRHAIIRINDGTYRLYQALVFSILQGLLCSGQVFHMHMGTSHDRTLLQGQRFAQKNQAPMGSAMANDTDSRLPPVLTHLGFLPLDSDKARQTEKHVTETPLPNNRAVLNDSLDVKIWNALVEKVLHENISTETPNHGSLSSQLPVPHLERLSFGVSNKNHSGPSKVFYSEGSPVAQLPQVDSHHRRQYLHKLMAIGFGSFMGGVAVILLLFMAVYFRCKLKQQQQNRIDIEAKPGDPKVMQGDTDPATMDIIRENTIRFPRTSNVSTSSGSAETSSTSSDNVSQNSDSMDLWMVPDQIVLSTIPLQATRRDSRDSPTPSYLSTSPVAILTGAEHLSNDSNCSRNTTTAHHLSEENTPCLDFPKTLQAGEELVGTEYISDEGAIISVPGTDIVTVIPPGAVVQGSVRVSVQAHSASEFPQIKKTSKEIFLSAVVELLSSETDLFAKCVTIKCPYRCLPSANPCQCEDDTMCGCTEGRIELRYCDTSTSDSAGRGQWSLVQCQVRGGHYGWSESLCPDTTQNSSHADSDDFTQIRQSLCHRRASVSYRCSDSVCCIETNAPGLYSLVYVPSRVNDSWTSSNSSSNPQWPVRLGLSPSCVRMCVVVCGRYHWQMAESSDGSNMRRLQQINYTVYLTDNTTSTKQGMCISLTSSDVHQECECLPIDIAAGSDIHVTLASVYDPDWQWEIPYDSATKVISWSILCEDFGSVASVEFRCLAKDDEGCMNSHQQRSQQQHIVTLFDISNITGDRRDDHNDKPMTIAASNQF